MGSRALQERQGVAEAAGRDFRKGVTGADATNARCEATKGSARPAQLKETIKLCKLTKGEDIEAYLQENDGSAQGRRRQVGISSNAQPHRQGAAGVHSHGYEGHQGLLAGEGDDFEQHPHRDVPS